jgi:hypothetical protein
LQSLVSKRFGVVRPESDMMLWPVSSSSLGLQVASSRIDRIPSTPSMPVEPLL